MKNKIRESGFTLIELLVVIAIICGLAAMLVPNFMGARQRGRDTQRKSDLKQIQKAMELYKLDANPVAYPTGMPAIGVGWSSATGNIYMNKVPADPSTNLKYYYTYDSTNLTYVLDACLENNADADANVANCPADYRANVGLGATPCSSTTPSRTQGSCYEVKQP